MPTATLTSKGQITLPKAVRDRLRVDAGDRVDFVVNEHGEIVLRSFGSDVRDLRGLLQRRGKKAVSVEAMNEAILREHSKKR